MIRILCINDHLVARTMLSIMLSRTGYEVLTADSSEEALEILAKEPVDLIIQDFIRPGMDGFEFLQRIKADDRQKSVPVLVVESASRQHCVEQLGLLGLDIDHDLDGYLAGITSHIDLVLTVRAILRKHGKI